MKCSTSIGRKRSLLLTAAVAASFSSVQPTLAAEEKPAALALEEVIVTARKKKESLQDVPVSVTAITEQLNHASVRNLQDLQGFAPNIIIDKVSALQGGAAISIRGVSYQEIDKSLDPPIGVILDGLYLGTNSGQILDNFDIERVEILRGPQGTLFGKNTIGGALSVTRTKPTKELGVKARVSLGNWGREDVRVLANAPVGEDGGVKFYYSNIQSDGYIKNTTYDDWAGGEDKEIFGATFVYDISDDLDVSLTFESTDDQSEVGAWANFNKFDEDGLGINPDTGLPIEIDFACTLSFILQEAVPRGCAKFDAGSDKSHSSQNAPNWADVTNDLVNLTVNWQLGDWTLTSITGAIDRDEDTRLEYGANALPFLEVLTYQTYEQFSQELRVIGDVGIVSLTAGVYYWDSEYTAAQDAFDMWEYFVPDVYAPGVYGHIEQEQTNEATAIFVNADVNVTDEFTINIGGRLTNEEKEMTAKTSEWFNTDADGNVFSYGGPLTATGPLPVDTRTESEDWTEFSPRLGISYEFSADLMAFTSIAKGFKSGGYFGRVTSTTNLLAYDPEYVTTWEAGIKSEWADRTLRFNATVFKSNYDDKQEDIIVADETGQVDTIVLNASDAKMRGIELELVAIVTENLRVSMQGGYLSAEYDKFIGDFDLDGDLDDNSGLEMRNAPERTFGISAAYNKPVHRGEVNVVYSYAWRSEYESIFNNDPLGHIDSVGIANMTIEYAFLDHYRISLYGRNLTDTRYVRPVLIPPVSSFGQYNEPRTFGIDFEVEF